MIKNVIAMLSVVGVLMLSPLAASASNYGFKNGDYVNINGYEFRVLDSTTDYLIHNRFYENRAFDLDSENRFDPNHVSSVGYYLNTTFLNNLGNFKNYIKNHTWFVGNELNEKSIEVTSKIGLPSRSEYFEYNLRSFITSDTNYGTYWLLTTYSADNIYTWGVRGGTEIDAYKAYYGIGLRPTLYLDTGLFVKKGLGTISEPYELITEDDIVLSDVTDISLLNTTPTEIVISWKNPTESNFSHVNVYKDGILIESNFKDDIYSFKGLSASKQYNFTFKAVNKKGVETIGKSIVVSTKDMPILPDVLNLKSEEKYDSVKLSWVRPESEFFSHVNLYRKDKGKVAEQQKQTALSKLFFGETVDAATTADGYKPMFATNGTFWQDYTVDAESVYEYKATTENIAGAESQGVTIEAITPPEPLPTLEGVTIDTDNETGNSILEWKKGELAEKVNVMIGGKLFKTVAATDEKITLTKEELNGQEVQLIPLKDNGTEGLPYKPVTVLKATLPFTTDNFLQLVMQIIKLFGPFILLGLSIWYAPRLIKLFRQSIDKKKGVR